jgi:hypothetical protein
MLYTESSRQLCNAGNVFFSCTLVIEVARQCVYFAHERIVIGFQPAKTGTENCCLIMILAKTNFAYPHCFQCKCQRSCTQRMDSAPCFSVFDSTFFVGQVVRVVRDFCHLYNFRYWASLAAG